MWQLSSAGRQAIDDIAKRHGFSTDAAVSMLQSVINGHGSMAQFSHPEFGGSGQWMQGGMVLVTDMFNNLLKGRIDALCRELSALAASQPGVVPSGSFQSQSQAGQQQGGSGPAGQVSLFVPPAGATGNWWPSNLGWPSSTGAQNSVRYAYFAQAQRLAIEIGGKVTVYDTLGHQITGFSQQQSHGGSLTLTSQYGLVDVAALPVVSGEEGLKSAPPPQAQPNSAAAQPAGDIFAALEKLGDLHGKGILSDEEFASKKAELLSRL
jgi:hypothetical protein